MSIKLKDTILENVNSANKLTSSAGGTTQPIYFKDGVPTNCTYTLGKSVPSDAKFTDTDTTYSQATSSTLGLVKIGYSASGKNYPVQLNSSGQMYVNVPWTDTDTNTDTKNTAGSTNSSSKLFLIGATSQAANPQTYSHDTAYVGTDGCLYSNSTKVSVEGHTHSYAGSDSVGGAATNATNLSRVGTNFTISSAGWYKIAYADTTDARGSVRFALYTVGGDYTPRYTELKVSNGWSSVDFIQLGKFDWISKYRYTTDSSKSYIEAYFTGKCTIYLLRLSGVGYVDDNGPAWTLYNTATTGSGSIAQESDHNANASLYSSGYINGAGFVMNGSNNSYVLLGGSGHKAISDFATSGHTHNYAGSSSAGGAATSANKLSTARTISLTGSVTGSGSFDGSGNLSIATTTNHSHSYASKVTVGTTAYSVSSNNITIPAYPTSLKCPNSLTIQGNGTSLGSYDGSAAKTINITYSNVGAAAASHGHSYFSMNSGVSLSSIVATADSTYLWNKSSNAFVFTNSNNAISLVVGGTSNDRNAMIQVGHNASNYGQHTGNLYLNKLGGKVYYGTSEVSVVGHTHSYAASSHTHTKSQITDFSHTHSYLPLSGGTLTGSVTFANGTWNVVGDDAAIGDYNAAGMLGLKSCNNNIPGIGFHNSSGTLLGSLTCDAVTLKW